MVLLEDPVQEVKWPLSSLHMTQSFGFTMVFVDYLWFTWQRKHLQHGDVNAAKFLAPSHLVRGGARTWQSSADFDVSLQMKDDNSASEGVVEVACVNYAEFTHECDAMTWITGCLSSIVQNDKLQSIPRIVEDNGFGDICNPSGGSQSQHALTWLDAMKDIGMMDQATVDNVLQIEKADEMMFNQLMPETPVSLSDISDAAMRSCSKQLCFSVPKLQEECKKLGYFND